MLREADSVRVEEDAFTAFTPALAMSAPGAAAAAMPRQRYGDTRSFNWPGAILTALIHILLIGTFFMIKDHIVKKQQERLAVVNLMPAAPPPPSTPEEQQPQQVKVVTPRPVVHIPIPTPMTVVTTPDPVPQPVAPAPPTASNPSPPAPPAPPSIIQANDLGARMIGGNPPRYPIDSRRLHEQGTVVLSLTLGFDGRVASISVTNSSGFARLDDAALSAVRKWRWEPIMRGGQPVMVRGLVEIPFVLKS